MLKVMTSPSCASNKAWRSDPGPLSSVFVTMGATCGRAIARTAGPVLARGPLLAPIAADDTATKPRLTAARRKPRREKALAIFFVGARETSSGRRASRNLLFVFIGEWD